MSDFVEGFDSYDEAMAKMAEREQAVNEGLTPQQIELRDDFAHTRYWVCVDQYTHSLMFGVTWSFKQMCELSAEYVSPRPGEGFPMTEEYLESLNEAVDEIRTAVDGRQRGYLRGRWWSPEELIGDYHDVHVSQVWPISHQAFQEAQEAGWRAVDVDPITLALVGEQGAKDAGWTPTLVRELREHDRAVEQQGD